MSKDKFISAADISAEHDIPSKKIKIGNNDDEDSWNIGKKRFVKVRDFKGNTYVDIREFYEDKGELKPSRKGIFLTLEQWNSLKRFTVDVDAAIKRRI